jgi:hypothetical protein
MRRWASGFFQNFQAHRREVFRSPAAMLVVGSLLFDLLSLPVTYAFVVSWALRSPSNLRWLAPSIAIHWVISMAVVTRTITWKQALRRVPFLLDRELVEQGDLLLDVHPGMDSRPPLHVVDGTAGTCDRNCTHERSWENRLRRGHGGRGSHHDELVRQRSRTPRCRGRERLALDHRRDICEPLVLWAGATFQSFRRTLRDARRRTGALPIGAFATPAWEWVWALGLVALALGLILVVIAFFAAEPHLDQQRSEARPPAQAW